MRIWCFVLAAFLNSGYLGAQQTAVTLSSSANPVIFGQPLTLIATVSPAASGKVTFYDGVAVLGIAPLAGGKATFTTSLLPSGTRSLRAYYAGSSSAVLSQIVNTVPASGFGLPVKYGDNEFFVAAADFNGDGKADLVKVDGHSSTVSVLLGNGDGTFQSPQTYDVGGIAYNVALGDFNGDGKTDMAVANGADNGNVSVFLGNGDGTFQPRIDYLAGNGTFSIAVGDFNGDGNADLAVTTAQSLSVLLGNGDGTFQPGWSYPMDLGGSSLAVGDFNGDGYADLAVGNAYGVTAFLGTGHGDFLPGKSSLAGASGANKMVVEDFNGDGKADLAVGGNGGASVLLGNGDGTFKISATYTSAIPVLVPGSAYQLYVATCDFNGDGKPDLAISDQGYVVVGYGRGDGTFTGLSALGPSNALLGASTVAVADFNGDGKADVVLGSGAILLGGVGRGTSTMLTSSANPSPFGQSVTLTASVSPSDATGSVTFYDGETALGTVGLAGALNTAKLSIGSHSLTAVYSGDFFHDPSTSPVLDEAIMQTTATTTTLSSSAAQITYGQSVTFTATVSPLTADGSVTFYDGAIVLGAQPLVGGQATFTTNQLATGTRTIRAYYTGNATYAPGASASVTIVVSGVLSNGVQAPVTYPVGGTGIALVLGDFNGDGKTDFAVAIGGGVSVLLGNGDGTFQAPLITTTAINPVNLATGDFNGDEKADLLVASGSGVVVLLGNGDGTFRSGATYPVGGYPTVADFNVDGKADFALGGEVFLGNGDGTFQPGAVWLAGGSPAADFNGDGILDFETFGNGVGVFLSNGNGTFSALPPFAVPTVAFTDFGYETAGVLDNYKIGDFNGDGIPDMVVISYTPEMFTRLAHYTATVYFGRGNGTFAGVGISFPYDSSIQEGDFNGDGRSDIVLSPDAVFLGRADGTFDTTGYVFPNVSGAVGVGEFNEDGRPDLVALTGTTVSVYLGKTTSVALTSSLDPSIYGQSVTITATFSPSTVTGSVTFHDGATVLGTAVLSNGQATLTTSSLAVGVHSLTATYAGSANIPTLTSPTLTQTVTTIPTSMTLMSSANPATVGETVMLTATISPPSLTGSIGFDDGKTLLGSSQLTSGTATLRIGTLAAGAHALTAVFAGDEDDSPSTSPVLTETINPGVPAETMLTSSANPVTFGQSVTLTATTSGSGEVTFFDGETILGIGAATGGRASLTTSMLPSGKRSLKAYFSGDGTYSPGFSPVLVQAVNTLSEYGFQTPINYATSSAVTATAVGDFNGDGNADLVVCDSAHLYVFLGNGDGTFQLATTIGSMGPVVSIGVADFNGDGKADLALGYGSPGSIVGVLSGNGDGTFQPQVNYTVGISPQSLAVADLNGDGVADILIGTYFGTPGSLGSIEVLSGNGDATFQPSQGILVSYVIPQGLLVADFNGDGMADMAFANGYNHSVGILLGKGNGLFNPIVSYDTGSLATPLSITSADFNGDGIVDLAVANGDGSVSVLLGNGNGTFQPAVNYSVGTPAAHASIAVGDFNGDGNADLVMANLAGVSILFGNGDGTLQPPLNYSVGGSSVVVADFNGDGRDDLLIANASSPGITVLLGSANTVMLGTGVLSSPHKVREP